MKVMLFAGQGSQFKGMGRALFERYPQETGRASEILGYSISDLCLLDAQHLLGQTEYTQPAIYVVSALAWLQYAQKGGQTAFAAGHSLGEYSALFAAGAFDFETGLRLVQRRGQLMGRVRDGGMLALTRTDLDAVRRLLTRPDLRAVDIANLNTPSQLIVSGPKDALDKTEKVCSELAIGCTRLVVSAAFHSRYMRDASKDFALFVREIAFEPLRFPVIANATAMPHEEGRVAELLVRQIHEPVRWCESIQYLLACAEQSADGLDFEELGQNPILTRMVTEIRKHDAPAHPHLPPAPHETLGIAAPRTSMVDGFCAKEQVDSLHSKEFQMPFSLTQMWNPKRGYAAWLQRRSQATASGNALSALLSDAGAVPPDASAPACEPIAIVGMSGAFPQAADVDAFWANLQAGRDCIGDVPASRWDWRAIWGDPTQGNKSNVKWGGFVDGVEEFDPLFFGISPKDAESMDPQQRLLMEHAWLAIEDAGYAPASLSGSKTGLFVGTGDSGYTRRVTNLTGHTAIGQMPSVGPNRISYLLNLRGPSEPVETACSSSLVAMARAVQSLRTGECEQAICGGVSTLVSPQMHISFNKAGMLSPEGRCKTFSAQADGYVRAEGVGMLVLKTLKDAQAAGDHIYGVILGAAVNHGGRANSFTAPNPQAQAQVIEAAWKQAGVPITRAGLIEAHGTGTRLGDPVEINGLKSAFANLGASDAEQPWCAVGALKSHVGHLELAAGVAGVIKVLLQMKHRKIIGNLHCAQVNPYIDLDASPLYLARESRPWQPVLDQAGLALPRVAGVSSFGVGGVNAHVVLQEYVQQQEQEQTGTPALVVLSARDDERLKEYTRKLLAFVQGDGRDVRLGDLSYTLQVGRQALDCRLAVLVQSTKELQDKLGRYLQAEEGVEYLWAGRSRKDAFDLLSDGERLQLQRQWLEGGNNAKLLQAWVRGMRIDWAELMTHRRGRRVSLPGYPFARERHWLPQELVLSTNPASDRHFPVDEPVKSQTAQSQAGHRQVSALEEPPHERAVRYAAGLLQQALTEWSPQAMQTLQKMAPIMEQAEHLISRRLGSVLAQLGLHTAMLHDELAILPAAVAQAGIESKYERWVPQALRFAAQADAAQAAADEAELMLQWHAFWDDAVAQQVLAVGERKVLEVALAALPDILLGRSRAVDVLFPQGSLALVEPIYRDSPLSRMLNERLAACVLECVRRRVEQAGDAKLSILEIGAGTGGTSSQLLAQLQPVGGHIGEYLFTDLSHAFLRQAERRYAEHTYLRCERLDISRPLAAQGLERLRARYDIVLAGNVLHATPDVAQALSNAKALLAPGGVLVLHELSQPSAAAHATFGLLDGWWLYTDSHVRQANSPLVAPHQWRELLTAQGFAPVKFPAQAAHALGHQIVCAQNEGPLQLADTQPQDDIGLDDKSLELAKAQILHAQSGSVMGDAELTVRLQQMLAASVAKLLQLGSQELDADTPLMEYGFDSISMAHWTDLLNTRFELGLLPTVLFEHPTLAGLTGYLVAHHREGLAQHFAAHGEHAAKPMRQAEPARPPQAPAPTIIQAQAPRPSLGPGPQGAELARHVNQALAASVAQLLQLKLSELDADTPLMEYGFDSISIAHWTDSLNTRFELGLLPTVLFEHPTLAGLTGYLVAHHGPQLARHFASEERAPAQQLALLNQRSSYAIH